MQPTKLSLRLTLLGAVVLFGSTTGAVAGSVSMTLTGASGPPDDGVIVGPYDAVIQGQAVKIICDDYDDHVHLGENWTAHISSLNNLSTVKFNTGSALFNYEAALWLAKKMVTSDSTQWGSIHFAMWAIFSTTASYSLGFQNDPIAQALYNQALHPSKPYQLSDFTGWHIYTPDANQFDEFGFPLTPQEYFVQVVQVAEAPSLLLLAVALIAVALAWRKFNLIVVR